MAAAFLHVGTTLAGSSDDILQHKFTPISQFVSHTAALKHVHIVTSGRVLPPLYLTRLIVLTYFNFRSFERPSHLKYLT